MIPVSIDAFRFNPASQEHLALEILAGKQPQFSMNVASHADARTWGRNA